MASTSFDSVNKIWSGGVGSTPLFHDNVTLGRSVLYLLNLNPEKVCQISADDGSKRTNGEIYQSTLKIAFNLQKLGCAKGNVVGFVCRNSHDLTPALLAAFFLGAPVNALRESFSKDMITEIFQITSPKFVFCDDDVVDKVEKSLLELNNKATIIVLGQRIDNALHISDLLVNNINQSDIMKMIMHPPEISKNACALILVSSGTTGHSKGVSMSHKALELMMFKQFLHEDVGPAKCTLFSLCPMFWITGYLALFGSIFAGWQRIITARPSNAMILVKIIKDYEVSYLLSVPFIATEVVKLNLEENSLPSIRKCILCGGHVTSELAEKFKALMPNGVLNVRYGTTETGKIACMNKPANKNGTGFLDKDVMIKILNDDGKSLGIGEAGEVCIKTGTQFLGYFGNPKATAAILDEDGWIHLGDIGYFDEEGLLTLTGRKKDIIKYDYLHINPKDIEQLLKRHRGVLEAVVVGIPDSASNDLPTAIVVRKDDAVTEEELEKFVQDNVEDFMRLRGGVFFVEKLPESKEAIREFAIKSYEIKKNPESS